MAPIKFEENIKDKLEKRTLSPSSESWSKLSERLDADEQKSKKPIFWWLSIAAGLLIMIAISVQFFGADESEKVMPQIVEEKVIEEQLEEVEPKIEDTKSIELVSEEDHIEAMQDNVPIIKEAQILDYKKVAQKKSEPKTQLAENNETSKNIQTNGIKEEVNNELQAELDNALMENAVASALNELRYENTSVTDREIDSLIKIASKDLFKEKLQKETSKTVDANTLLMSVEDEMGQSFRSKVFDALKDSYKTVKTAVVQRNN